MYFVGGKDVSLYSSTDASLLTEMECDSLFYDLFAPSLRGPKEGELPIDANAKMVARGVL
jgi:hypothetical protein